MKNTKEEVMYYVNFTCNVIEYLALDVHLFFFLKRIPTGSYHNFQVYRNVGEEK